MWDRARTVLLVTLVTLAIWIWAEAESLEIASPTVAIEFTDADGEIIVRPDPAWPSTAQLRIEGATVAIEDARRLVGAPIRLTPGLGGVPRAPGEHSVDLLQALRANAEVRRAGVTVLEVEPRSVQVQIDEMVTRALPVRVESRGVNLAGEPTVAPAEVRVRMPAAIAQRLPPDAAVQAVVSPEEAGRLADAGPQSLVVPVRLPIELEGQRPVVVTPDKIRVTLQVRGSTRRLVLPSVPVFLKIPPNEGTRWDVSVEPALLQQVTVSGPADLVEQVERGAIQVLAEVLLTSDELEARITRKNARFGALPTPLRLEVDDAEVRLIIKPRAEGAAPGG